MGRRRVLILVLLAFLVGSVFGIAVGPRAHVMFWTAVLEYHPNYWGKWKAGLHLSDTEMGTHILYDRVASSNIMVRRVSEYWVPFVAKPYYALTLLAYVPENRIDEKLDIISGVDYPYQHREAVVWLRATARTTKSARLKNEIEKVLQAVREADQPKPPPAKSSSQAPNAMQRK